MSVVLSVFRRPEMLLALLSERREPFDPSGRGHPDPYVDRMVPFASVPETLCPWRDAELKAWKALGRVPNLTAGAVKAIIRSLLGSVPEPRKVVSEPAPPALGRGSVDLRPSLCHPIGEEWLIAQLGDAIPTPQQGDLPTHRRELSALPEDFRRYFLWSMSLSSWEQIEATLAVFESLSLSSSRSLLRAVARLLRLARRDTGLWWCDVLAEIDPSEQLRACELILEYRAMNCMPDQTIRAAFSAGLGPAVGDALQDLVATSSP